MKTLATIVLGALLALACVTSPAEPKSGMTTSPVGEEVRSFVAITSNIDSKEFRILKVFHITQKDALEYPLCLQAFIDACTAWVQAVPILEVYIDLEGHKGIHVSFTDIQAWGSHAGWLGYWNGKKIVIDDSVEELEPRFTRKIIMHELGHCLGLPHIVGRRTADGSMYKYPCDGAFLVETDELAQQYLMYPIAMSHKGEAPDNSFKISHLEAYMAQQRLLSSK